MYYSTSVFNGYAKRCAWFETSSLRCLFFFTLPLEIIILTTIPAFFRSSSRKVISLSFLSSPTTMSDLPPMEKFNVKKQRSRADTETLLEPFIPLSSPTSPNSPGPITQMADMDAYTPARLVKGLQFADTRLAGSRRLTPRSMRALSLYKDTIKHALSAKTDEERLVNVTRVQLLEDQFNKDMFLVGEVSDEEEQLDMDLVEMRETAYFARYGDYFADSLRRSRRDSSAGQTPGHERLSGSHRWSEIWVQLQHERSLVPKPLGYRANSEWNAWFSGETGKAIARACHRLELNSERLLKLIEHYADRNTASHKGNDELIRSGDWLGLAKTICADLQELPMTIPPTRQDDLLLIKAAVEEYRDHYFDIYAFGAPDNPATWKQTPNADAARTKLFEQAKRKYLAARRKTAARRVTTRGMSASSSDERDPVGG